MNIKIKLKNVLLSLLVLVIGALIVWGNFPTITPTYAANTDNKFDDTNVLDDLKSADGFNILNYPFDSTGVVKHPEIINVVEYCYSYKVNMQSNYGLYLYFYNPQGLNIKTDSKSNKIQLATAYGKDKEGNTIATAYDKFDLQFCSVSVEPNYYRLFYKFKVVDKVGTDGKKIVARVNSNERRYDISGVELHTSGATNATEYTVGGTYTFTGYAKGYGSDSNAESNLISAVRNLETISLDLAGKYDGVDKRTYWRSNSSSLGEHHQNQINSVFFAIDKTVLNKYGYILQRIKAEWHEYKTRPTVIIDNLDIYNKLLNYKGVKISESYDCSRGFTLDYYKTTPTQGFSNYGWSWNGELNSDFGNITVSDDIETLLPLLFYAEGKKVDDYTLLPDTLYSYLESYNKSYDKGKIQINDRTFSADLFNDNVDNGRTKGYNLREFDIGNPDDYWDIRSYDSTHNWWSKLWDYGFGSITTNDEYPDVSPIQMITAQDMSSSDLANHLKINPDDVDTFKNYYNSIKKDKELFIFRYAQTDYFSTHLNTFDIANAVNYSYVSYKPNDKHIADLRQGTQFFDFDILEFTFNKDGVYTVIPVVSSPIDHISGYTPPIDPVGNDWWKIILAVIALVLIVILLAPILPFIIKPILWLITLPFKLIGAMFKGIKNAVSSKKKKE